MESLSRILKVMAMKKDFEYHWKCKQNKITHICFADNLIIFCKVEEKFIKLIKDSLLLFENWFGLKANNSKSNIYFFRVNQQEKCILKGIMGFEEGVILFRYLGVLMVLTKLSKKDC